MVAEQLDGGVGLDVLGGEQTARLGGEAGG
jgi:hypothetical protein